MDPESIPRGKQLTLYEGGLSKEQSAAAKVRRKLEALNEAVEEARTVGVRTEYDKALTNQPLTVRLTLTL